MPLGQGYTIEGQITGKEVGHIFPNIVYRCFIHPAFIFVQDVGGLQIDVFRAYSTSVRFAQDGRDLSLFKTPRELGLKIDSTLVMEDLNIP